MLISPTFPLRCALMAVMAAVPSVRAQDDASAPAPATAPAAAGVAGAEVVPAAEVAPVTAEPGPNAAGEGVSEVAPNAAGGGEGGVEALRGRRQYETPSL